MDSHFSFKENVVLKRLHSSILLAETRRHEKYNRDELSIKKHLFQEIVGPLLVKVLLTKLALRSSDKFDLKFRSVITFQGTGSAIL